MAKKAESSTAVESNGHANRAAGHLKAMEAQAPSAVKPIVVPTYNLQTIQLKIGGDAPLICHAWDEKAKRQMLEKQMGTATAGKSFKDPQSDFLNSLYPFPGGGYGFPAIAFKSAAVTACTSLGKAVTKVAARQAFHIIGDLVRIEGEPTMREDMVRVGMGTADIRYRGEFKEWSCVLTIRYNACLITAEQLVNLINLAGFAVGVGEWRPERDGQFGLFHVA